MNFSSDQTSTIQRETRVGLSVQSVIQSLGNLRALRDIQQGWWSSDPPQWNLYRAGSHSELKEMKCVWTEIKRLSYVSTLEAPLGHCRTGGLGKGRSFRGAEGDIWSFSQA